MQKEAEKAKTGPVSAPQASFLTSGLPDVAEGSAPSTPTQVKEEQQDMEEAKPADPTVDNTEVADMEIEDDSDGEKSETSEEAGSETKGSNNQTPTSSESSESQQVPPISKQVEVSAVVTTVTTMEAAQTPSLTMPQAQGRSLQPQQPIGTHQPPVGLVVSPYVGLQGVQFPAHPLQFRPSMPLMQSAPSSVRNTILPPSQHLPGPGEVSSHSPNVSQIDGKPVPIVPMAGVSEVLPSASVQPPGSLGMLQTTLGSTSFGSGQAPLPVALVSLPPSVQTQTSTALTNQQSNTLVKRLQEQTDIGSPDSETSAPSPVGSPELHLDEGDETPETTPAPLGDVGISSNIGFQTNKSFFEHPLPSNLTIGADTHSALIGYSGPASGSMASSGTPPLQDSAPVAFDQLGEHQEQAAQPKKENGQNVSAVDILAQLLSRGRQLQQASDVVAPVQSMPVTTPVSVAVTVSSPLPVKEPTSAPQSKPLLSLIDSLFPKLSDSIKTLKEKERASGSQDHQAYPVTEARIGPSSGPAKPLPSKGHLQQHSQGPFIKEQPTPQQTEPDLQRPNQSTHTPGESIIPTDITRPSANNHNQPVTSVQVPVEAGLSPRLPVERPVERPLDVHIEPSDSPRCGPLSNQDMHHPLQQVHQTGPSDMSARTFLNHCDAPVRQHIQGPSQGHSPVFPLERPMGRSPDLPPRAVQPFGPRLGFSAPCGPHFNTAVGSTVPGRFPPFEVPGKGSPDIRAQGPSPRGTLMEGPPRVAPDGSPHDQGHSPRGSFIEGPPHRLAEVPPDIPGRFPLECPLQGPTHSSRGSFPQGPPRRLGGGPPSMPRRVPSDVPPHCHSPRDLFTDSPPYGRLGEAPQDMGGRLSSEGPPPAHSPRGVVLDGPSQRQGEGPPEMPGKLLSEDPQQSHPFRGPLVAGPPRRPLENPNCLQEQHLPIEGQAQPVSGTTNPGTLVPEGRCPSDPHNEDVSNCAPIILEEGRPDIRRPFNEAGPPRNPNLSCPRLLPPPHPRDDAPQIHHGPHPGVIDGQDHRREFEHRDDIRMDQFGNRGRGPWDLPRDRPGPKSSVHPDRRGPRVSPRMPPKRVDFRDDDPSMWTSFESPGRSPGRHGDFANTMHESYWEGPSDGNRFHEFGPPQRRRHPFENERMRFPGPPMKRPGPPPVSFSGPPKRPFY